MPGPLLFVNATAIHGGAEEALLTYMRAAETLDYRPLLAAPGAGWLTRQCEAAGYRWYAVPSLPEVTTTARWQAQLGPLPRTATGLARLIRQTGAVLVHSNGARAAYHGGLAARLARVPALGHVHDIANLPFYSAPRGRFLAAVNRVFVAVSGAVTVAILDRAPYLRGRVATIYNTVDVTALNAGPAPDVRRLFGLPPDSPIIGSVSAMSPWKGQALVIKAFACVHRRFPNTRLVIIGGSQGMRIQEEYAASLHAQVRQAGLDDAVIFAGWREDAVSLMRGFDIFVHAPTEPDPLPTVVLQAAAVGRPIVGACIGGIPEIAPDGECGLLVAPRDPAGLAQAVERLLADAPLRRRLGSAAQARIQSTFSPDRLQNGLARVYNTVLT